MSHAFTLELCNLIGLQIFCSRNKPDIATLRSRPGWGHAQLHCKYLVRTSKASRYLVHAQHCNFVCIIIYARVDKSRSVELLELIAVQFNSVVAEEARHPRVKGSVLDSHCLGQSSIACYLPNTSTGLFLAAKSLICALFDLGYSY